MGSIVCMASMRAKQQKFDELWLILTFIYGLPTKYKKLILAKTGGVHPINGEESKQETALGSTLPAISPFLICAKSPRLRHFPHSQLTVQKGNPNLNEQVRTLIGPTHLPLFCAPQALWRQPPPSQTPPQRKNVLKLNVARLLTLVRKDFLSHSNPHESIFRLGAF